MRPPTACCLPLSNPPPVHLQDAELSQTAAKSLSGQLSLSRPLSRNLNLCLLVIVCSSGKDPQDSPLPCLHGDFLEQNLEHFSHSQLFHLPPLSASSNSVIPETLSTQSKRWRDALDC